MRCDHPQCTGNHHQYPNFCPAAKEKNRLRKHKESYREHERQRHRKDYAALDGVAYSHLLLKHRRAKALTRIRLRGGLPSPATGRKTKQT
jgi:hypothetical protein